MPITDVKTLNDVVGDSVARPRFAMLLLGAFGALALLLAARSLSRAMRWSLSNS